MNILRRKEGNKSIIMVEVNGEFHNLKDQDIAGGSTASLIQESKDLTSMIGEKYEKNFQFDLPLTPGKIFLPALNFRSHVNESKFERPEKPYFFTKFQNALVPPNGSVVRPRGVSRLDYEGEIAIVIGKRGKYLDPGSAEDHIFGYAIVDDVSLRDYQMNTDPSFGKDFVMGKCADTALPIGPWVTTKDAVNFDELVISTYVNGELRQNGSVKDMIFSKEELISQISKVNTLEPGDIISTGTPSGVAEYTSRRYLSPGDTVEIKVNGIGSLKHKIIEETYTS